MTDRNLTLALGSATEAGFDEARLHLIRERSASWIDADTNALAILGARNGTVALYEAAGNRTRGDDDDPITLETLFHAGSIAKVVTATAVMILAERGLLNITRFAKEYVPELKAAGSDLIMIRHLLTHTSGYSDEICRPALEQHRATDFKNLDLSEPDETEDHFVRRGFHAQNVATLAFEPGKRMEYCNYNYLVLGELVRRASGHSFKQFVEQEIFAPLGMTNSYLGIDEEIVSRVALRGEGDMFSMLDDVNGWAPLPPVGLRTTAWDLAIFVQTFLNGGTYDGVRLLSPASVEVMSTNQIPGVGYELDGWHDEASWGLGWGVQSADRAPTFDGALKSVGSFSHSGIGSSIVWADPSRELLGIYLSVCRYTDSTFPTPLAHTVSRSWHADTFQDMLTSACL
jgi:CubicO group peptidase (beta-lactamase class C family)